MVHYIEITKPTPYPHAKLRSIQVTARVQGEANILYQLIRQSLREPDKRPLLIVLNPFGGEKQAFRLYEKVVRPMLEEAGINHDVSMTEYRLHAQLVTHSLQLSKYCGLLVIGGDGLLHECINGLLSRSDWRSASTFPIGLIPAGTSNAVARSIGTTDPVYAVYTAIRGTTAHFDSVIYEQGEHRFYGHFACMFGLVADVDIGSEAWRCLGRGRLTCTMLLRLMQLRSYHAEISYIPDGVQIEGSSDSNQGATDRPPMRYKSLFLQKDPRIETIPETQYYSFLATKFPYLDRDVRMSQYVETRSGLLDLLMLPKRPNGLTRWKLLKSCWYSDGAMLNDDPAVGDHRCAKACMLRFRQYEGALLDVDGEEVPNANIYFECLPNALLFFVHDTQ